MRRAAILLVLTLSALLAAAPASAGGPTSVLVTVPGAGRSTALYYTDTAYERLSEALGVGQRVREVRDAPNDFRDGPPVILTWLIHDVMVWRVDQVYVHDGTTYVLTQENVGGGPLSEGTSVLHEAGPGLTRILDRLLPTGNGYLRDTPVDTDPAAAARAEPEPAAEVAAPVEATSPRLLVAVGVVGLLVGAVGTLIGLAPIRSVRGRPALDGRSPADDAGSDDRQRLLRLGG